MRTQTVLSGKGQVVLPASTRQRFGWNAGIKLDIVEHANGVTLVAHTPRETVPAEEVFARLRAINPYRGPKVTKEEVDQLIMNEAAKRYDRL